MKFNSKNSFKSLDTISSSGKEYKIFNLGEKKIKAIRYIDWFNIEAENIHQRMYEIATRGVPAGGSEQQV